MQRFKNLRTQDSVEYLRSVVRTLEKENETLLEEVAGQHARSIQDERTKEQLRTSLKIMEEEMRGRRHEGDGLRAIEIEAAKRRHLTQLESIQFQNRRLKEHVQELQHKHADLNSRCVSQISQLRLDLKYAVQERDRLKYQLRNSEDASHSGVAQIRRKYENLLQDLNMSHQKVMESMEVRSAGLEKQNYQLKLKLQVSEVEIQKLLQEKMRLTAEIREKDEDHGAKSVMLQTLRQENTALRTDVANLQQRLAEDRVEIQGVEEQRKALAIQLQKRASAQAELVLLRQDLAQLSIRADRQAMRLSRQKQQILMRLGQQTTLRERLQNRLVVMTHELAHLDERSAIKAEQTGKELDQITGQAIARQKELTMLLKVQQAQTQRLSLMLKNSQQTFKKTVEQMQADRQLQVQKFKSKVEALSQTINMSKSETSLAGDTNLTLRRQIETVTKRALMAQQRCEKLKEEAEQLRRKNAEDAKSNADNCESQRVMLEMGFSRRLQLMRAESQKQLHGLRQEIERLKIEVQRRDRNVEQLMRAATMLQRRQEQLVRQEQGRQGIQAKGSQNSVQSKISKHIYDIYLKRRLLGIDVTNQ